MSFVKALFGGVVGEISLREGQIGHTDNDFAFKDLEKDGIVKLFDTYEEAEAFQYTSREELFKQSFPSLNPPEGEVVPESKIDWGVGPLVTDGVPSNQSSVTPEFEDKLSTPVSKDTKK